MDYHHYLHNTYINLDRICQVDVGGPGVDGALGGHHRVGDDDLLARDQRVVGRRVQVEVRPGGRLLGLLQIIL